MATKEDILEQIVEECTSSANLGPMGPIFKRHFSASCFSSLACKSQVV